jgi:hypothetical protein
MVRDGEMVGIVASWKSGWPMMTNPLFSFQTKTRSLSDVAGDIMHNNVGQSRVNQRIVDG